MIRAEPGCVPACGSVVWGGLLPVPVLLHPHIKSAVIVLLQAKVSA